jgi:hypothetical protein
LGIELKKVVNLYAEWRNPTFAEAPVGKGHKGKKSLVLPTVKPLSRLIIIS